MEAPLQIKLHHFQSMDQLATRELILSGLREHWGELNDQLNQDLDDIQANYAGSVFIVAKLGERIIGTGALSPRSDTIAEIVRMSVTKDMRRQRVGTMILLRLVEEAKLLGFTQIILETNCILERSHCFLRRIWFPKNTRAFRFIRNRCLFFT